MSRFADPLSLFPVVGSSDPKSLQTCELVARLHWLIRTRWIAAALCFLGTIGAIFPPLHSAFGGNVDYRYSLTVTVFLAGSNIFYYENSLKLMVAGHPRDQVYNNLYLQVFTDYINISLLVYCLGGIETPVFILFFPYIIISSVFFTRFHSFAMTLAASFFAVLPMVLEYLGIVPIISIFGTSHKMTIISSGAIILSGYILAITASFLFSWYLASAITSSLCRRESQLEQALEQLTLLNQEKSQVTLRAIHELKAPFAAIKSYVYSLRDGYCGVLPEKALQSVLRIGVRCDLLTEKITGIIHLSNLRTTSKDSVHFSEVDLVAVLTQEVEEARLIGEPRGITVKADLHPSPCFIMAALEPLHTLVSNVLQNAIIYSHDHGVVELSLECLENGVSLKVRDHGIGIPKGYEEKIFQEHFRANNAVRHNPNSSGMGLPLVKEIVRIHGGDIHVTSETDSGTCFSVYFSR